MKNQSMKRILAILISLMMLIGCIGLPSFAEEFDAPQTETTVPTAENETSSDVNTAPGQLYRTA